MSDKVEHIDPNDKNLVGQVLYFLSKDAKRLNDWMMEIEKEVKGKVSKEHMDEYIETVKRLEDFVRRIEEKEVREEAAKEAVEEHIRKELEKKDDEHKEELEEIEKDTAKKLNQRSKILIWGAVITIAVTIAIAYYQVTASAEEPPRTEYPSPR